MPTKPVVKGNESNHIIFDYKPKEIDRSAPIEARDLLEREEREPSDFKINELTANQVGITKLQKASIEGKIEEQALIRLKEVQEKAYQEAYELGLVEGREKAYEDVKGDLVERLDKIDSLLATFEVVKEKLLADNEAHLMKLLFQVASRIALREIKDNESSIVEVIRQALEDAQSEERITLRLAQRDLEFIEDLRSRSSRDTSFLERLKLEPSESIKEGGCILETNYGSIDATIEERLERVWKALEEKIPRHKGSIEE